MSGRDQSTLEDEMLIETKSEKSTLGEGEAYNTAPNSKPGEAEDMNEEYKMATASDPESVNDPTNSIQGVPNPDAKNGESEIISKWKREFEEDLKKRNEKAELKKQEYRKQSSEKLKQIMEEYNKEVNDRISQNNKISEANRAELTREPEAQELWSWVHKKIVQPDIEGMANRSLRTSEDSIDQYNKWESDTSRMKSAIASVYKNH